MCVSKHVSSAAADVMPCNIAKFVPCPRIPFYYPRGSTLGAKCHPSKNLAYVQWPDTSFVMITKHQVGSWHLSWCSPPVECQPLGWVPGWVSVSRRRPKWKMENGGQREKSRAGGWPRVDHISSRTWCLGANTISPQREREWMRSKRSADVIAFADGNCHAGGDQGVAATREEPPPLLSATCDRAVCAPRNAYAHCFGCCNGQ